MQRGKSIKNISEIEEYTADDSILLSTYARVLKLFNLWGISRMLSNVKERGIPAIQLFQALVVFPFLNIENIYNLFLSKMGSQVVGCKNTYYRFLHNEWIPWRKILYAFTRQFLKRAKEQDTEQSTSPICLIIDDTTLEKTGKKIENIGKVFDHTVMRYILGFKGLFAGLWDGKSFIPVDFSFHHEPGKKGKRGLKTHELEDQSSYERSSRSPGYQRAQEVKTDKISRAIQMIKQALRLCADVDYILADSWFMSKDFIKAIRTSTKKNKRCPHILGMFKMRRNVLYNGKEKNLRQLPHLLRSKQRNCKTHNCMYIPIQVDYKGIELTIFLIRMKGQQSWKALATTDNKLSFTKAMKTYAIRWAIEVFFKDMKQYLQLGKCQSQNFNAHIAHTTLSCIQFIILAFAKRIDDYESIGGIFEHVKEFFIKEHLMQRLWQLMKHLYMQVLIHFGLDLSAFMHAVFHSQKVQSILDNLLLVCSSTKIQHNPIN